MTTTQLLQPPASPCILDVWDQGIREDPICAKAMGMLLLSQPQRVHEVGSFQAVERCFRQALEIEKPEGAGHSANTLIWLLALAQLHTIAGQPKEATSCYRRAIDSIMLNARDPQALSALAERLDPIFAKAGQEGIARAVRLRLERQILMARNDAGGLDALRESAFEAFGSGDYAEAERIYTHLLANNFEVGGTHCHLARIYLATDRHAEASRAVEMAWQHRGEVPPYIVARIHFFRALLATLVGENASLHLAAVTDLMSQPACQHSWIMAPVLESLRPRLSSESFALFTRLAETLNGRAE